MKKIKSKMPCKETPKQMREKNKMLHKQMAKVNEGEEHDAM
jgi:hypothetical protein